MAQRTQSTRVQYGEYTRLSIGRYFRYLGEPALAQHLHRQLTAFCHAAILGSNRRLPDPMLQSLDGLIMLFFDLRPNWLQFGIVGVRKMRHGEGCSTKRSGFDKVSAVHMV